MNQADNETIDLLGPALTALNDRCFGKWRKEYRQSLPGFPIHEVFKRTAEISSYKV